jgi:predicted AAA+ superfamily ATPase
MYKRRISLDLTNTESAFLWGARQTGKRTLLKSLFPDAIRYDLLLSHEFHRLIQNPGIIREELHSQSITGENQKQPVIIDEIQKVPDLLDEIHWLIENLKIRFILCGSSARKLRRGHSKLLGGRAVRYEMHPLVYPEIPDFSLDTALNQGMLPRHYQHSSPKRLLQSYVGDYLQEEISAEALVRNVQSFSRFLEVAAISNGEIINYENIARECAVSAPTVKEYYQIAVDTLVGSFLPAYTKTIKRRLIHAPKFYFFDIGVVGELCKRGRIEYGSELFGKAFEHFIYLEILAFNHYSGLYFPLSYWRTASQIEVDFLLGNAEVALEIKSTNNTNSHHLKGLRSFKEEHPNARAILVSHDPNPRTTDDGLEILPWEIFLNKLWSGEIIR